MSFLSELKRRNVLRVGAAYVVGAWLIIQVTETVLPLFGFDETPARLVVIALAIGFIPALIFSWAFEWTPEGLVKEEDLDRSKPVVSATAKRLDRLIMVVLALALGYFAFDKFVLSESREASIAEEARQEGRSEALVQAFGDKSIAVLPFVNMSSDPEQEFFADGITEELLNMLARVSDLRVTARTSSFFFKNKNMPISEIAEALNVRHVLEGSVRRSGNRVRITAQLIEAKSDTHIWSNTYDRELKDVFQIQDEVASAIADALVESFEGLDAKPVSRADNLAAFEAFRTGRLRWWRRSPQELHSAIELFERAIDLDPNFAPAHAAAADSWLLLVVYGDVQILNGIERAEPMIERALQIDPDSAEGLAARGLSLTIIDENDAAETSLRAAIASDSEYIPAYLWLATTLGAVGRLPEQGAVLLEALARDPLNELLTINYATNLQARGDQQAARQLLDGLIRLRPNFPVLLNSLSNQALDSGQLLEAWKYAKRSLDLDPDNVISLQGLARVWLELGEFQESERLLLIGRERAGSNVEIKLQYFSQLLLEGRTDEADQVFIQVFGRNPESLPESIQREYHYRAGFLSAVKGEFSQARDHLSLSINPDESQLFDENQVFALTTLSLLNRGLGNTELAESNLALAERVVGHARVNGFDNAEIYYQLAAIAALRGEKVRAIQTLQQAYKKGWRGKWLLDIDARLDPLRDEPLFQALLGQIKSDQKLARQEVQSIGPDSRQ